MRKALVLLLAAVLFSCGGEGDLPKREARVKPEPKPLTLEVRNPSQRVTTNQTISIVGRVTPDATVTVGGKDAEVRDGRFRARVRLKVGVNRVKITARKPGYTHEAQLLRIKRSQPRPASTPAQTAPATPKQPETSQQQTPPSAPEPNINPNCPGGQEPTTSGGCKTYDERDGQVEPKINDPGCYSDKPPAGCF